MGWLSGTVLELELNVSRGMMERICSVGSRINSDLSKDLGWRR
jgi:hypothetical protein